MSEHELMLRARDLILVVMSNASTDKIPPMDWWPRAKAALVAGAARGRSWGQMVNVMCSKLQIETLRNDSASLVCSMSIDGSHLRDFKRVVMDLGTYIVAEAQAERERQREAQREEKKA
jgi:hypothetical protein